jgi:tripartite-type tricarboxylate transporter receptor subunit TctC
MTLACASAAAVFAQPQYPTKPIRLIVPTAPGGFADISARIVSQGLSEPLGKQVMVDNRAGAGGNISAEIAAKSAPDGHTLLWGFIGHAINVTLYDKLNYDFVRELAPVSLVLSGPFVVVVHPALPAKSVKELVALAKSRPNQLDFASSASASYLVGLLFTQTAGVKMTHVPYKGAGPALTALLGGEVQVAFPAISGAIPFIKSGKLRGLGITSLQRSSAAPDLPTVSEAGLNGYEATTWYGLMTPTGTPKEIISRLHDEMVKVLKRPDVKERLAAAGADPIGSTPEQFTAYIRSEIDKWGKLVKMSGARPD